MEIIHGRVFPQVRGANVGGRGLELYKVSFSWITKLMDFLVEG